MHRKELSATCLSFVEVQVSENDEIKHFLKEQVHIREIYLSSQWRKEQEVEKCVIEMEGE